MLGHAINYELSGDDHLETFKSPELERFASVVINVRAAVTVSNYESHTDLRMNTRRGRVDAAKSLLLVPQTVYVFVSFLLR